MNLNLNSERLKWATIAWQSSVAEKATTATSVQEYIELLLQPLFDEQANAMADSWKPKDAPEVAQRRESLAESIKTLSPEKLEAVEAAIAEQLLDGNIDVIKSDSVGV